MQVQVLKQVRALAVAKSDVLEVDGPAQRYEVLGLRGVPHRMGLADVAESLGNGPQLLGRAEQGESQVAGAEQDAEGQGAGQQHLAGGDAGQGPQAEWPRPA